MLQNLRKNKLAFSLLEIIVVIAVAGLLTSFAIPTYKRYKYKAQVSKIVNKMSTFKNEIVDSYSGTGSWPALVNNVGTGGSSSNSDFAYANAFYQNSNGNKFWMGYQLIEEYGTGWIGMVLIANTDGVFETHCGAFTSGCGTLGSCNSYEYFPAGCKELDLITTLSLPT